MPESTKELSDDGRPSYLVHGKVFCFHRGRRPDAVAPDTGERLDDVLMFRVDDLDAKELVLATRAGSSSRRRTSTAMRRPDPDPISRSSIGASFATSS